MRTRRRATWIGSALTFALFTAIHLASGPAEAQPKKKPKKAPKESTVNVGECVDFDQQQDDGGIHFNLRSTCTADLECNVSWALRCDGDANRRQEARAFVLSAGSAGGAYASAADCGDRGWSIAQVKWSCRGSE